MIRVINRVMKKVNLIIGLGGITITLFPAIQLKNPQT